MKGRSGGERENRRKYFFGERGTTKKEKKL
jgi:hypothetical protein